MKKTLIMAAILCVSLLTSGCIGRMATSGLVTKANLKLVDNRYARAGIFILSAPVYAITSPVDLFIVNSIEFWMGKNPINGKPAVADIHANSLVKTNGALNHSLTKAPLQ